MSESTRLDGETAIVTGANAGIGAESATQLAAAGAEVVLAARREDRLEAVAADIRSAGGTAMVAPTDVTDEQAVAALVETTVEKFGSVDIVVNNAGVGRGDSVAEMETEAYRQMMDVNVDGVFFLTRAALPHLIESEGNLIYIGSFAGQYPRPSNPVYAATKWWVRGFAKSVMAQVGEEGLAVSIINPSEVRTEFGSEDGQPFQERFEPGSVSEPAEVAEAVCYAASQDHSTAAEIDLFRRDKFAAFEKKR
ncbi:SDR family oxidoreductase [Halodesulfurarchaeum formicicum]|uniref:Short-chain dehydrogenase n=1 Tax=Halodesulfurarchaeum formicicum TaxID=1873524 RepID=A0A1J1ACI6_9EURY|nr:SDR family oxidoreductase [Halodesulfurarchaeum formicicum]APE95472.1 short-chain dehydrogenase [Halodesulfurarchaeum formicicum]